MRAIGNRWPGDPMEAVAAGNEIARQLDPRAILLERDLRMISLKVCGLHVGNVEEDRAVVGESGGDEILDDLMLGIDRDRAPACQLVHIYAVADAVEAQLDAVMDDALALHALADAQPNQQIACSLFEHARAD